MTDRRIIPGSERSPLPGSRIVGDAEPTAEATVTVFLRSEGGDVPPPGALSRVEFADAYGAAPADVQKVEAFGRAHGLRVVESSVGTAQRRAAGNVAQLSAAFGVTLKQCEAGGVMYRGREGGISVPADIAPVVQAVLGLDDRPQAEAARTHRGATDGIVHPGADRGFV